MLSDALLITTHIVTAPAVATRPIIAPATIAFVFVVLFPASFSADAAVSTASAGVASAAKAGTEINAKIKNTARVSEGQNIILYAEKAK